MFTPAEIEGAFRKLFGMYDKEKVSLLKSAFKEEIASISTDTLAWKYEKSAAMPHEFREMLSIGDLDEWHGFPLLAGFSVISKQLHSEGCYLAGVPGFYHTPDGGWSLIQEKRGIIVPVKTPEGKIQGLQIRRDYVKKGKFRWLSSVGKQDGCKAETWTHIAGKPTPEVLITEGPLKADIIHRITGLTVIAVPGVNSLSHLKETLDYVQAHGTNKIMTCFDMDYLKNPHVRDGYRSITSPRTYSVSKNLFWESLYSKRLMKDQDGEFALRERLLIQYGDKYYPVKKYAVDLSELTDANKQNYATADKNWYLTLRGLFRNHTEQKAISDRFIPTQELCLILTIRDPARQARVYDEVTQGLDTYNFWHSNIKISSDVSVVV